MSIIRIDIDDEACAEVMRRHRFATISETVNFALRKIVHEKVSLEEVLAMRGMGWESDLEEMHGGGSQ